MSLPIQMAIKPNQINPTPSVLPLQLQMQMMPHAQAQAQAQAQAMVPAPHSQIQQAEVSSILAETTSSTWLAIGSLAESLGDLEKATSLYDTALRHNPNNPDALTRLANIYRSRDHFLKAAELYEQALNFYPENGDTWGLLGHCYLMMDDLQRAYAAYQRALYYLENPNVPKLWHGIGILYDRYGSLEYAEEAFVRVLDLDPNFDKSNEIYFRLGIIYKHQGKLSSALECFQYILSYPPHPLTQPDVWFQIGSVLEQQKNWNGAKEAYEKVLEVNPNHAKVLQQLGCLYSQAEATATTAPHNGQKPFQQDLAIALKYLTQSIEIDSTDAHSWYYLGRVHMIRGDFNAAYEAFQQAVNRDSRNPTFWCSIGVLYYQILQYRDALDAYTRAIRLNPYISEVWYDLGTLYESCNNQISDALDAYRQAERLDPGNPHIKARLEQLIKYQQDGNTHPPQPPPVSQQPRLPQGMILESMQPQQGPGVPGAQPGPGQPQLGISGQSPPPPPPQLSQQTPQAGAYRQPLHQPPPALPSVSSQVLQPPAAVPQFQPPPAQQPQQPPQQPPQQSPQQSLTQSQTQQPPLPQQQQQQQPEQQPTQPPQPVAAIQPPAPQLMNMLHAKPPAVQASDAKDASTALPVPQVTGASAVAENGVTREPAAPVKHDLDEKPDAKVAKKPNNNEAADSQPEVQVAEPERAQSNSTTGLKSPEGATRVLNAIPEPRADTFPAKETTAPPPPQNVGIPPASGQVPNTDSVASTNSSDRPVPTKDNNDPANANGSTISGADSIFKPAPDIPDENTKNDDDDDDEDEDNSKSGSVEPPMREVEEDENYDDE